jgi:hypothetical protein
MDLGYVVIAIFLGIVAMVIWAARGRWNGKRDRYRHNPLPGHRQAGSDGHGGGSD